jgi:hypothetical protein
MISLRIHYFAMKDLRDKNIIAVAPVLYMVFTLYFTALVGSLFFLNEN